MSGSEERARNIVAEVFGPDTSGHPQPPSTIAATSEPAEPVSAIAATSEPAEPVSAIAATSEPAGGLPATTAASRPAVSPRIARRAREVVDAVFDPPPPAPPPAPPPPSASTLAARRIVAEAEASADARRAAEAAEARRAEEERARQAAEEQERQEAAQREETAQRAPQAAVSEPAVAGDVASDAEIEGDRRGGEAPPPVPDRLFPPDDRDDAPLFTEVPTTATIDPATARGAPGRDPMPGHSSAGTPAPASATASRPTAPGPSAPVRAPSIQPPDADGPPQPPPTTQRPPEPHRDVDPAQVAARLAAEALEHRERSLDVDHDDDHTTFLEPSSGRRAGRWLVVTILAAVALAWLLPVTIAAVLELVSLS